MLPPVICLETYHTSTAEMDKTVKTFIGLLNDALDVKTDHLYLRIVLEDVSFEFGLGL